MVKYSENHITLQICIGAKEMEDNETGIHGSAKISPKEIPKTRDGNLASVKNIGKRVSNQITRFERKEANARKNI